MSVMPETGLEPTMAIALAATVVKRKAITVMVIRATMACRSVIFTPIIRKMNTARSVRNRKSVTNDIFRSRSLLLTATCSPPPPFLPTANLKALPITPDDLMMPMIPAMAMAPIPMGRTYSAKIASADMAANGFTPPDAAANAPISLTSGISTSHETSEPTVMITAKRNPTR